MAVFVLLEKQNISQGRKSTYLTDFLEAKAAVGACVRRLVFANYICGHSILRRVHLLFLFMFLLTTKGTKCYQLTDTEKKKKKVAEVFSFRPTNLTTTKHGTQRASWTAEIGSHSGANFLVYDYIWGDLEMRRTTAELVPHLFSVSHRDHDVSFRIWYELSLSFFLVLSFCFPLVRPWLETMHPPPI